MKNFEIFPWNKNFETGINIIDSQHKVLVELLNQLALNLANRSCEITLNIALEQLTQYTDYHFKTEEILWEEYLENDEHYKSHVKTHRSFIDKIVALKNSTKSLDQSIYEVVSFLSKWLAFHILDTDKRMAKTIELIKNGKSIKNAKFLANEHMEGSNKILINTILDMYETLSNNSLDLMREKALRLQAEEALHKSEEKWKFILEGGVENVWDWNLSNNDFKTSSSEKSLFSLVGKSLKIDGEVSVHPFDIDNFRNSFEEHMKGLTDFFSVKYRILRKNGSWSWMLSRGKIVSRNSNGNALRMVGTHSDITEREMAASIFHNSSQAIFVTDMNNNIISVNKAFTEITGFEEDEVIGKNPKFLSSGLHDKYYYKKIWKEIDEKGKWQGEITNKRKSGEVYPEYLSINTIKDMSGNIDHYFAIFEDITQKKKTEELIIKQANYDSLTKLINRNLFKNRLDDEIKRAKNFRIPFALMYIDLDNFKDINDVFGHEIGDLLLVEVSKRLSKHLREIDTLARIGGDEFTIIYTNFVNPLQFEEKMKKILECLNEPFLIDMNQLHISASIGVTICPNDSSISSELLKNADQAMYLSKKLGKNCYSYFTNSMQEEAKLRQEIINDLHKAIKLNEFEVYYQPIIDLKSKKLVKAEALLRWKHSKKGFISPDIFIPYAETSGLIIDIGNWVFYEAVKQTKEWNEKYNQDIQISINISPIQFHSKDIVDVWINQLKKIDFPTKNCVLEITENTLMENHHDFQEKIHELRSEGIKISLDDFGTGYSSLSYLQKFDIDFVKIDRSFIMDLNEENQDFSLCDAIISMANKLDIKVIAEGVETKFQQQFLEKLKCDYVQGYYFSKPLPKDKFEELLLNFN